MYNFKYILTFVFIILAYSKFSIKNRKFYDPNGGEVTFHGINVGNKWHPYYKVQFNETKLKMLKQWGLNGMRVLIMWSGVQPQQGKYNETYLQHMLNFVNTAGEKYGIYSLIQFHQDIFSEFICPDNGGDGFPNWAISQQIKKYMPFPFSFDTKKGKCHLPWTQYYFTYGINRAFQSLYSNENNLLTKFTGYWKKIAQTFKNNPYVIGYQILNEPWPGNIYEQIYLLIPGLSQLIHLQNFSDIVAKQIRSVDPEQNICYQPVTWLNGYPSGYTHPPGGQQYADRSFLCFHYYALVSKNMDSFLYARLLDMDRLNIGGILTQFSAQTDQFFDNQIQNPILDRMDKYQLSWFAWQYNEVYLKPAMIKRTYAQRVGGIKQSQFYNNHSQQYRLTYRSIPSAGETIIFYNYDHYLFGEQNSMDKQLRVKDHKQVPPLKLQDLNMIISTFPKVQYIIKENMYIVIDSGSLREGNVLVKIQRKQNYVNQNSVVQKLKNSNQKQLSKSSQKIDNSNQKNKIKVSQQKVYNFINDQVFPVGSLKNISIKKTQVQKGRQNYHQQQQNNNLRFNIY